MCYFFFRIHASRQVIGAGPRRPAKALDPKNTCPLECSAAYSATSALADSLVESTSLQENKAFDDFFVSYPRSARVFFI